MHLNFNSLKQIKLVLVGEKSFLTGTILRKNGVKKVKCRNARPDPTNVFIHNNSIALRLVMIGTAVQQIYYAKNIIGEWQKVCSSFRPDFKSFPEGNKLFDTKITQYRYQPNEIVQKWNIITKSKDKIVVSLTGKLRDDVINETISLQKNDGYFHHEVTAELSEPILDYLLCSYEFFSEGVPDFIHSPTIKKDDSRSGPGCGQVIGDHAFHSPAIILQKGNLFTALVPDLDSINQFRIISPDARRKQNAARNGFSVPIVDEFYTMPTALDLQLQSGLTDNPVLSYGMMDFIVSQHIRYQRINDESMIRKLHNNNVKIGFDLFVGAQEPVYCGYQKISRFLWNKYGHETIQGHIHLVMPFEEYVKTVYKVVATPMDTEVQPPVPGYEDHGVFLDFEKNGEDVGGMVAPLKVLGFGDALWSFEFWNPVRDASGMYYWGKKLNMPELVGRSKRIINLALQSPQNESGFFCLIYFAESQKWIPSSIGTGGNPFTIFQQTDTFYDIPAMSKTAAHLLEYYEQCDKDKRILEYLVRYADGLLTKIDVQGLIPSYYSADGKESDILGYSAQPAASMWFLADLYRCTNQAKYLEGAKKIASFLMKEIIPEQKWIDLEPYFSCGENPLTFLHDDEQRLLVRGNLSAIWAAEGFASLFRATSDKQYSDAGERVVDYLAFSQACWAPHYVYTAFPFGGCTADNVDTATWLDARQCELVKPFIWYGIQLGRQDLLERGIAAARASTVLINLPEHQTNNIYSYTNKYGFGLGPENINHEGHNQSAMRTHPSWGECSGIFTGLGNADRLLGGCYVDVKKNTAVGSDGVTVKDMKFDNNTLCLAIENMLIKIKTPYSKKFDIMLRVNGLVKTEKYSLVINNKPAVNITGQELELIRLSIDKNGITVLNK